MLRSSELDLVEVALRQSSENRRETVSEKLGEVISEVVLMEEEQRLHSREMQWSWGMARRQAGRRAG
jgi:ABC-type dipeptide/oligopeptide/nickel transport system ATPase component